MSYKVNNSVVSLSFATALPVSYLFLSLFVNPLRVLLTLKRWTMEMDITDDNMWNYYDRERFHKWCTRFRFVFPQVRKYQYRVMFYPESSFYQWYLQTDTCLLDCGRKLRRTWRKMQTQYRMSAQVNEPGAFLLWVNNANRCAAVLPCCC